MSTLRWLVGLLMGCVAAGQGYAEVSSTPVAGALEVIWNMATPVAWIAPGGESTAAVSLRNPSPATVTGTCRLEVGDGAHMEALPDMPLSLPPGASRAVAIPLAGKPRGVYQVAYAITVADHVQSGRLSLLYAVPAGEGPDPAGFLYGVHLGRAPDRERAIAAAGLIGINTLRVDAGWLPRERVPGTWDWTELDQTIALCTAHGMQPQMLLAYGNPYAAQPNAEQEAEYRRLLHTSRGQAEWLYDRVAQEDGAWRRFVAATATRYHATVHWWEVWNEPDLRSFFMGTTDDYLRMLRAAHDEIKRIDSGAQVMTGGFATTTEPVEKINVGLQERVLREAGDAFEVHAYHGHGPFPRFQGVVDGGLKTLRSGLKEFRPLYFNETAVTATGIGEAEQAATLVKKLTFARARGAIGYTWYNLCNDGFDARNEEHNYGLLTRDFQPKPVYGAYNQLITALRGAVFDGELALGAGRWCLVFRSPGARTMVVWKEDGALPDDLVMIRAPGCRSAEQVDLMGNALPLAVQDEVALIAITQQPVYVVWHAAAALPQILGPLLSVDTGDFAVPGQPHAVALTVRNVQPRAAEVDLTWQCVGAEHGEAMLAVPAGGQVATTIQLTCPTTATFTRPARLTITAAVRQTAFVGTAAVPLAAFQLLPRGVSWDAAPDFVLAEYAQVVNYFEANPATQHLTWRGPDDLSARIWLRHDREKLYLRAAVRDDVHFQDGDARSAWKGDGLQFAMQLDGQAGYWELGAALANDGRAIASLWKQPDGFSVAGAQLGLRCTRTADGVVYDVELPYAACGLSAAAVEHDFAFNLIVNDSDGDHLRKGFIRIAPGIGESKDPRWFPHLRFVAE